MIVVDVNFAFWCFPTTFSFSAMGKGAGYLQRGLPPNSKPDAKFALNQRGWWSWRVSLSHIQKRQSYVFLRDISHILLVSCPSLSTWQCRSVTSCLGNFTRASHSLRSACRKGAFCKVILHGYKRKGRERRVKGCTSLISPINICR